MSDRSETYRRHRLQRHRRWARIRAIKFVQQVSIPIAVDETRGVDVAIPIVAADERRSLRDERTSRGGGGRGAHAAPMGSKGGGRGVEVHDVAAVGLLGGKFVRV